MGFIQTLLRIVAEFFLRFLGFLLYPPLLEERDSFIPSRISTILLHPLSDIRSLSILSLILPASGPDIIPVSVLSRSAIVAPRNISYPRPPKVRHWLSTLMARFRSHRVIPWFLR